MIHLDTGHLIAMAKAADAHHSKAVDLVKQSVGFANSSVAWMEFLFRPVHPVEIEALGAILTGGIISVDEPVATLAGELFHATGSNRLTRLDTMIAATAIHSGAELTTTNPDNFQPFVAHGLKLHAG